MLSNLTTLAMVRLPFQSFEDDVHTVRRVRHGLFRVFGHGRGEVRRLLLPVVDDGVDLVGVVGPDDVLLHDVAP